MEVKFEVTVEDMLADKDKPKKFKGSLHVPEVSPDSSQETPYTTKWKKLLPANLQERVKAAASELGKQLQQKLLLFHQEYKSL